MGVERSVGRGDRGVDPRPALRARSPEAGAGRIAWIGFAEAVGVAVGRFPYDVQVPESRLSGEIRSDGAWAEVEKSDHVECACWSAVG
jgi:hypothetical protein